MALKNIKISSEFLQNCKKCIPGKSLSQFSTATNLLKNEENDERSNLFKVELGNNSEMSNSNEMKFLQPALLPRIPDPIPSLNFHGLDPFPGPLREYNKSYVEYNDGRILKSSIKINPPKSNFKIIQKKMSTTSQRSYSQKKRVDPNKGQACEEKKKPKCNMSECPRFHLENCKQTKGSDCRHLYQNPNCKKQFAPYPSYSESCAVRLPDDPSECFRCPWTKCRDVENIRPQKRKLHTGRHAPGSPTFTIPPGVVMKLDGDRVGECNKKDPCKRPPGVCEERERKKKKEECEHPKKKHNPCKKMGMSSRWKAAYGFVKAKEDPLERDWVDFEENSRGLFASHKRKGSKGCGHEGGGGRKRRCSSETRGLMMTSRDKNAEKCPEKKKDECPKRKIRPRHVDREINKKDQDHHSGHPPPCEDRKHRRDEPCKPPPKIHPYRQQRDLYGPVYRKKDP